MTNQLDVAAYCSRVPWGKGSECDLGMWLSGILVTHKRDVGQLHGVQGALDFGLIPYTVQRCAKKRADQEVREARSSLRLAFDVYY